MQTEKWQNCFSSSHYFFLSSYLPFFPGFYFCQSNMFLLLLADGPTDVTVSCLVHLSSFGSEQDVPKKQIAITFALNIQSPQRMIPNDCSDPLTLRPSGQNEHYTQNKLNSNEQIGVKFIQHIHTPQWMTSFHFGCTMNSPIMSPVRKKLLMFQINQIRICNVTVVAQWSFLGDNVRALSL